MKIRRLIVCALLLVLLGCVVTEISPFAAPLIAHHQTKGILTTLLNELLKPHKQSLVEQYYPYILLAIIAMVYALMSYDMKHRPRTTHGSAETARGRAIRKYHTPRNARTSRPGHQVVQPLARARTGRQEFRLVLGRYRGRTISLGEQQQYQHLMLTAPTGAGKSVRVLIANLLRETGLHSLFVADLKNELYPITAGWLSQFMPIRLFAPTQPTMSVGYNPLAHMRSVEDAQDFAATWVANTGKNDKDTFWETNSQLLISAVVLHLLVSEQAPAFSRLADILTTYSFEEIRDLLRATRSRDARYIARQFLENMEKNDRFVGSQMADVGNRFQLLASQNARAVTATNDIDFEEMIQTPTAFFLSIPRSATIRYRPLMACLTQQMFAAWEQHGTNGIRCYLDEFSNIGYIPGFAEFVSTARSLHVSLLMAIQNFSQLVERYGKNDAETIKANAVTHLLLPGAGLEECRYYSERIGDTTVATESVNRRGSGWSAEITSTEGETRRRLMTPEELRTMDTNQMLLLEASAAPLVLTTTPYFEDKELAARANMPYQGGATYVHPVPPMTPPPAAAPRSANGLPPASASSAQPPIPPIIVDADQDDDEDAQFFLQE